MERFNFNPADGFLDASSYQNPQNESEVREQLQSLHNQTKDFINGSIKSVVDRLENNEILQITSGDNSVIVTKNGKTIDLRVSIQGQGATIGYVDSKTSEALASSKSYTDEKKVYLENKIDYLTNRYVGIVERLSGLSFEVITRAEWERLPTPRPEKTLYIITG